MAMVFSIGIENPVVPRDLTMELTWRLLTLLMLVTPVAAWIVQQVDYYVSVWLLILGNTIIIVTAQQSYPTSVDLIGLAFLTALAGLFVGKWASVAAGRGVQPLSCGWQRPNPYQALAKV
jgi:hypothetical protein